MSLLLFAVRCTHSTTSCQALQRMTRISDTSVFLIARVRSRDRIIMQPNVLDLTQCIAMHYNAPTYALLLPTQQVSMGRQARIWPALCRYRWVCVRVHIRTHRGTG